MYVVCMTKNNNNIWVTAITVIMPVTSDQSRPLIGVPTYNIILHQGKILSVCANLQYYHQERISENRRGQLMFSVKYDCIQNYCILISFWTKTWTCTFSRNILFVGITVNRHKTQVYRKQNLSKLLPSIIVKNNVTENARESTVLCNY